VNDCDAVRDEVGVDQAQRRKTGTKAVIPEVSTNASAINVTSENVVANIIL
jgi:hypothetical protein